MSRTVLVADDSLTIRQIVGMALKASPYQVVEAQSARATMEALKRARPDIILLDYYMPDGSGYDICRALKKNESMRHIPVIMLGGTYKNFDESKARQMGADGILLKPFKTDQLIAILENITTSGASGQAVPAAPLAGRPAAPKQQQRPAQPQPTAAPQAQARDHIKSGPRHMPAEPTQQSLTPPPDARPSSPGYSSGKSSPEKISTPGMDKSQMETFIRGEVRKVVREELPGLLRSVMSELVQQKLMPKLLQHSEDRVKTVLAEQLENRVQEQVRFELERLLSEE